VSERNFLGRGQKLDFNILGTADTLNYNIGFVEPAFLGRDVALGLDFAFVESNEDDNTQFDTAIGAFRPSLTFPTGDNGRLSLFYNGRYEDMSNFNGISNVLAVEINEGDLWTSAVGYDYSYDTRRSGLDPNSGVLLSFGQEFAGLGGDNDYIKTSARAVGQTMVLNEEVTLRATAQAGAIHFSSGSSRFLNRFNDQVMRGFEPNGMGPVEGDEHLGGDYFAVLKFEAEFPLGLPDEYGVTGGAFYDIGSIWGIDDRGVANVNSEGFEPRHVVGVSVFWKSPFGPLRMDFSNVLESEPGDLDQNFNLTVRTEF
jgi:outer membrane protein insertion porin family